MDAPAFRSVTRQVACRQRPQNRHGRRCSHAAVLIAPSSLSVTPARHGSTASPAAIQNTLGAGEASRAFCWRAGRKPKGYCRHLFTAGSFRDTVQYSSSTKYPWATTTSYSGGDVDANYVCTCRWIVCGRINIHLSCRLEFRRKEGESSEKKRERLKTPSFFGSAASRSVFVDGHCWSSGAVGKIPVCGRSCRNRRGLLNIPGCRVW